MGKICMIGSMKGGVAKTVTTFNLRILDPSYAGELTVLPKANGVLLEVED